LSTGDGSSVTQRLPPQMVDEALIISDMFELNEISSLQLLLQGNHCTKFWLVLNIMVPGEGALPAKANTEGD